jgi:hypothetical protein
MLAPAPEPALEPEPELQAGAAAVALSSTPSGAELPSELWIQIASLLDGRTLGRLACVSVRFAVHDIPDPAHRGRLRPPECWRLVDEAARRAFVARPQFVQAWFIGQQGRSRSRLWLEACSHANAMSAPLAFTPSQCHDGVRLSKGNTEAELNTECTAPNATGYGAAISQTVMKAGRHYAEFKITDESTITMVGVISNADFMPPPTGGRTDGQLQQHQQQQQRPATAGPVREARAQQAERLRELAGVYEGVHQVRAPSCISAHQNEIRKLHAIA